MVVNRGWVQGSGLYGNRMRRGWILTLVAQPDLKGTQRVPDGRNPTLTGPDARGGPGVFMRGGRKLPEQLA